MDRQPLTDRLGDRLLAEYGGAAAAYSLRALNGNGDNVVRVRRASDNDEKDFTAEQIELGEMVNWVNSQTVPPLDIGVETSEGRIPVPEGGTSIGTPAAAYSLRNLSTTYTGNVVDVRRSSDDAVESFTAEEVSDGTLEAWVLAPVSSLIGNEFWLDGVDDYLDVGAPLLPATGDFDIEFTWYVANESNPATYLYALSQGTSISNFLGVGLTIAGKIIVYHCTASAVFTSTLSYLQKFVKIRLQKVSGNLTVYLDDVSQATVAVTGSILQTNARWGDTTFLTGNRNAFGLIYGDDVTGTANGSPELFTGQGFDGTVSKWYDQSGNDNHATQGTDANQPTIVEGGSLVTGGIDFDGVDDFMELGDLGLSQPNSVVFVHNSDTDGGGNVNKNDFLDGTSASTGRTLIDHAGTVYRIFAGASEDTSKTLVANQDALVFVTLNDGSSEFSLDGSNETGLTAGTNGMDEMTLGASISGGRYDGTFAEFIIYPSDQSDNRTAIEANIGETYGITGIPAYDNTVDGFVETWYDQSGNGNDATQSVAASQPKIVDGGVLVSGNTGEPAFTGDGVDDILSLSSSIDFGTGEFFVSTVADVNTGGALIGSAVPNWLLLLTTSSIQVRASNTNTIYVISPDSVLTAGESYLISLSRVENDITAYVNGVAQADVETVASTDTFSADRFLQRGTNGNPYSDPVSEVIIYDSDQSDNRTAIEGNINAHYDIYA